MENKLISIVLPVYNGEKFLRDSINSVINQTYKNWELIIVNDCSTDNSLKIAQEYEQLDKRIKVISNETNKKLPASLNIGFKEAKGEYLTWTSDDNMYKPKALEKMYEVLSNNQKSLMVCASYDILDKDTTLTKAPDSLPDSLLFSNTIGSCFLYKRDVLELVGEYDENCFLVEDYDYWLRIGLIGEILTIKDNLYVHRLQEKSLTSNNRDKILTKTIELQFIYLNQYANLFQHMKKNKKYLLYEKINNIKNIQDIKNINDLHNKKELFMLYKAKFISTKNKIYLTAISNLGIKFRLKSIFLKHKKYEKALKKYDKRLDSDGWGELYNENLVQTIIEKINNKNFSVQTAEMLKIARKSDKILEVASGTGETSLCLAHYNGSICTALDYEQKCINLTNIVASNLNINLRTICIDATENLPFEENEFDIIFHAGLLEHFDKNERISMLKHWKKYCKKMISMVPNASSLAYRIGKKNMEKKGTWEYGLEIPIHSQIEDFIESGYRIEAEYTIGVEHALEFLEKSKLKSCLLESLKQGYEKDLYYQGYLLVTIGVKDV